MDVISKKSAWDTARMGLFLSEAVIPVRIAVNDGDFPMICSIWFYYDAEREQLVCASHQRSKLARLLQQNPRCGFEIAPNEPPYCGVRGKATVEMDPAQAAKSLQILIQKYLGQSNSGLGQWLLSRVDEEYEIRLTPTWVTAWDYGQRMEATID